MKISYEKDQELQKAAGLRYRSVATCLELVVEPKPEPEVLDEGNGEQTGEESPTE